MNKAQLEVVIEGKVVQARTKSGEMIPISSEIFSHRLECSPGKDNIILRLGLNEEDEVVFGMEIPAMTPERLRVVRNGDVRVSIGNGNGVKELEDSKGTTVPIGNALIQAWLGEMGVTAVWFENGQQIKSKRT